MELPRVSPGVSWMRPQSAFQKSGEAGINVLMLCFHGLHCLASKTPRPILMPRTLLSFGEMHPEGDATPLKEMPTAKPRRIPWLYGPVLRPSHMNYPERGGVYKESCNPWSPPLGPLMQVGRTKALEIKSRGARATSSNISGHCDSVRAPYFGASNRAFRSTQQFLILFDKFLTYVWPSLRMRRTSRNIQIDLATPSCQFNWLGWTRMTANRASRLALKPLRPCGFTAGWLV
jgi:hypothetical protein